jgi:hypothetical protein
VKWYGIDFQGFILLTYLYCDITLTSNTVLPDLFQTNMGGGGLNFTLKKAREQLSDMTWSHYWYAKNGEPVLLYCKRDSYHLLRFPGMADFQISENAKKISCYPSLGLPLETLQHLLLDQILPRCLAQEGRIMLHASGVKLSQGMILFIGDSGAGKSTLAGNFHLTGFPAISDDCLWIKERNGEIVAVPTYTGLRLWDDSLEFLIPHGQASRSMAHYSRKKRVNLNEAANFHTESGLRVVAMIELIPGGQHSASKVLLERLPHREAFIKMLKQTFQLDLKDMERVKNHVRCLGRMVPRIPSFSLSIPHEYGLLPVVRQKILETVL